MGGNRPMNGAFTAQPNYYPPAQQNGYPADRNQFQAPNNGGHQPNGYVRADAGGFPMNGGYQRPPQQQDWWTTAN